MNDPVWLSRLQFGITIGFHFVFVTISLGMAWLLFAMESMAWRAGQPEWDRAARFFGRIFIITFALTLLVLRSSRSWVRYDRI